ncbi:MAG: gliding motility-associated C-terminal domain-containing protein [Flavobacteriales bacterium]|nr:gliding motility-associated C-terminal domain-containing protein [Flavobacteriales bacterium]
MKSQWFQRILLITTLSLGAISSTCGQDFFEIDNGDITTCGGVLEDSGGGFAQYGPNENFTATICPANAGDAISLNWLIANLSLAGPNPPDRIRIFDGDNTSANSLGEYYGTDLQNLIVSATTFNTTGCLTVQFLSNANGVGDFAASITCYTPCERPTAVATMSEAIPALVCVGEEVSFDGSGSYPASALFNIVSYTWNFDDGTTASGPLATHSFSEPGEYIVQLDLLDDNDCANSNVVDLQVLVSTTPVFNGTTESSVSCVGATVDLNAEVEPVTWTGIPDANFGGAVYLPDDPGLPFTSEINFEAFEPGQTIDNVSNFLSICVEMEHSYMGDLVLQVICPNGQSMLLHQQGGGNTYLGSPNDFDTDDNPIAGECWQYCWTPTATNGTWVENSNNGTTPNTIPGGIDNPGNSLEPGTYEPVGTFNSLIGCPLNGVWTYQSTDFLGADNGFICSWSIEFDPAIIPDVTQFTPVPGISVSDSATWSGPGLAMDPLNPLAGSASLSTPGDYDYTFSVTDNFGCTYDTTITITVPVPPILEAGDPIVLCSDPLPMAGSILANAPPPPFVFEWTPTTGLDDPTDPETDVFVTEPTLFYLSTYPEGHPECAVTDSVWVSPDPSIDAGVSTTIILCANDPLFLLTDSLDGTPDGGGVWTSSTGAVVGDTFDPNVGASDVYTYTVTSPAGCEATSTLDITVIPAADPACCGVVDAGPAAFSCGLTIELSATRGNTGVGNWQGPAGAVFADPFNTVTAVTVQPGMGGTHTFYWVENDGAFCDLIDSVRITFTDAYVFTPTVTDALCYGYSDGAIAMDVTGGNAAAGLDFSWSTGLQGIMEDTITDLLAGTYSLLVTDDNGCTGTTEVLVGQPIRLEIDSMAMLPVTCSGDCDGTVLVFDVEAVEYSYDDGTTWTTDPTRPASCEGVWVVRIKDAIGCIGIDQIEVMGPPPVVAAFDWGPNPANVDAPTITFANTSTGSDHYFWNVADLFSTTDLNTVFTFDNKEPDMYEVCLTAYNYNECSDTICQTVVIDDVLFTYIPNAFTPDGDDVNDVWWPSANIPVRTNYELLVFDRWGQVVFNTTDPYMPWEGSYQNGGETLKSDVYAFRLLYGIGDTEARKEVVGYVTLMK